MIYTFIIEFFANLRLLWSAFILMPIDQSKLKKVCITVLREHIGLAAQPIANEIVSAYALESTRTLQAEYSADYMSGFFTQVLAVKLPAKLPIRTIASNIAAAYHHV